MKSYEYLLAHFPCSSIKKKETRPYGVIYQCGNRTVFVLLDFYNKIRAILPFEVEPADKEVKLSDLKSCTPLTRINGRKGFVCNNFVGIVKGNKIVWYQKST
mgnify:CR=1 FL=1